MLPKNFLEILILLKKYNYFFIKKIKSYFNMNKINFSVLWLIWLQSFVNITLQIQFPIFKHKNGIACSGGDIQANLVFISSLIHQI